MNVRNDKELFANVNLARFFKWCQEKGGMPMDDLNNMKLENRKTYNKYHARIARMTLDIRSGIFNHIEEFLTKSDNDYILVMYLACMIQDNIDRRTWKNIAKIKPPPDCLEAMQIHDIFMKKRERPDIFEWNDLYFLMGGNDAR